MVSINIVKELTYTDIWLSIYKVEWYTQIYKLSQHLAEDELKGYLMLFR